MRDGKRPGMTPMFFRGVVFYWNLLKFSLVECTRSRGIMRIFVQGQGVLTSHQGALR